MMNAHHGKLPIPLPTITDDPRWIGRFSREVRKSIAALRDRRVIVSGGQKAGGGSRRDHLQPYIFKEGENQKIAITPGFFGAIIPTFAGGSLTDIPAPSVTLIASTQLWLVVEWEPASEEDAGLHWIMPGGNLISAAFEISESPPSETAPNVTEAGVITNGVFSILWGDISETGGKFNLDSYRSENRAPGFCPPNNLEYPIG